VTEQQRQHILDLPKVLAGAVASPSAALLTSHFGVAGTFVGLALSAVIVTVISDILKVYLARAPGAVTKIEGGFTKKPRWQRPFYRLRQPFSKFLSLAPTNRRSILFGSLIAGGISFLVGLIVITGLELSVGKNLSCWVWDNCPTASSTDGETSSTSTLPSILGGGWSTGNNALPVAPSNPQQQTPGAPAPSQAPDVSGSQNPDNASPPQPDQRQSPSGVPEDQQQNPSSWENQQQYPSGTPEDQQLRSPSTPEDQQQDYYSNAPENQQPSPADSSRSQKQQNPAPPASQDDNNP
jgi:hypothetical protein